jgi:prepilin-type N-terminal cleavage/methylation domain-containing protein
VTHAHRTTRIRRGAARRRGFNLVELLLALAISAALLTSTMVALDASFMAYQATTELASTHTVARLALHRMMALIRTGQEFGPFPADPNDSIVATDEIEFLTPDGAGGFQVMSLRWVESDPLLEDNALYIVIAGNSYLLLEGVVPQFDDDGEQVMPFTLEYELGRNLHRATIDLLIEPDDNQSTEVDQSVGGQRIHLVASAMPRIAAY